MEEKKKEKKIVFSEEIDSAINGFSLVVTFIVIGIFLIFNNSYFGNEKVASIIQWTFIIIGSLGFATEISKMNKQRGIKGIDDLVTGIFVIAIWAIIYYKVNSWVGNTIAFFFFIMGLYGSSRGIIEIGYSIIRIKKKNNTEKKHNLNIAKDVVLILSEIAGIGLIFVQILQAVKIL